MPFYYVWTPEKLELNQPTIIKCIPIRAHCYKYIFLKRVPVKPSGKFGDDTGTGSMVTSQHVKMTSRRFIKTSTLISNLDNSNPYEKSRRNSTEKILSGIRPNGQTKVSNSFAFKIFKGSVDCEKKHSISNETIFSSLK